MNFSKVKTNDLIVLSFLCLSGCSLAVPDSRSITISFPSGLVANSRASLGPPHARSFDSPPETLANFNCFGINITGPGIRPNPNLSTCSTPGSVGAGLVAGLSDVGKDSIVVDVPTGPARLIQLFAVQSSVGCPSVDEIMTTPTLKAGMGSPYLLGSAIVDITADTVVSIQAQWDPANPVRVFCPDDRPSNGTPSSPGLVRQLAFFQPFNQNPDPLINLTTQVGVPLPFEIGVQVLDAGGSLIPNATGEIILSLSTRSDCSDTISNLMPVSAPIPSSTAAPTMPTQVGVASAFISTNSSAIFSGVSLNVSGSVYLRAQSGGALPACRGPITVQPEAASQSGQLGSSGVVPANPISLTGNANTQLPTQILVYAPPPVAGAICRAVFVGLTDESYLPAFLNSPISLLLKAWIPPLASGGQSASSAVVNFFSDSGCSQAATIVGLPQGQAEVQVWIKETGSGRVWLQAAQAGSSVSSIRAGLFDLSF